MAAYARVAENRAKVVTCIRLASDAELDEVNWHPNLRPVWVIDRPLRSVWGRQLRLAADRMLVPLTPPPGTEVTTTDADKPVEVA